MKFEGGGLEKGFRGPDGGSFENLPERGSSKDERLSNDEALLYQEYATKIEGREFSEQADKESYKEAENLIEKLRGSGLDWVGIEWDKIDLKDIRQIRGTQERLDTVARLVLESRAKDGTKEENQKWKEVVSKTRGVLLPFVAAMGILMGCSSAEKTEVENQLAGGNSGSIGSEEFKRNDQPDYIEARVESDGGSVIDFENVVKDWLYENMDEGTNPIQSIIIDSVDYAQDYKKEESVANARIIILTDNQGVYVFNGSYSIHNGGIEKESQNSDLTPYNKWRNYDAAGFVEITAKKKAVLNALEMFGSKLKLVKK